MQTVMPNSLIRWSSSAVSGVLITLGLFWFMNFMISSDDNRLMEGSTYKLIDFVQLKQKALDPDVKKELPPEPKKEEVPPKLPNKVVESKSTQTMQDQTPLDLDVPNLNAGMKIGGGIPKGLASMKMAKVDSALTPMVQIKPVYPSSARRMKVEGYVKVELNVDATGRVLSTKILKSVPEGVFDKSVKKAIRRWKFRPKTVNGVAVTQTGVLTLNFKLGNN